MTETIAARDICAVRQYCAEVWERGCVRRKYGHKGDTGQCRRDAHGWVLSVQKVGLILFVHVTSTLSSAIVACVCTNPHKRSFSGAVHFADDNVMPGVHLGAVAFVLYGFRNAGQRLWAPAYAANGTLAGDRVHAAEHSGTR
jgi:hypothetical protein